MNMQDVLDKLEGVKKAGAYHTAKCPAHEDRENSLSIKEMDGGKISIQCYAGCDIKDVLARLDMTLADLYPDGGRNGTGRRNGRTRRAEIVATYDYVDAEGRLVFQVVRMSPKGFRQRRPDPSKPGEWIWNLEGVDRPLYNLPAVLEAQAAGRKVFLVEGEKDVESLRTLDLVATTNAGGAAKWRKEYSDVLNAGAVVILPDNDEPGWKHARMVHGKLRESIIVELPDLPPKGDVSDWIRAGGTREDLIALAKDGWANRETVNSLNAMETLLPCIQADAPEATLAGLRPFVSELLGGTGDNLPEGNQRARFEAAAGQVGNLLLAQDRLLLDTSATDPEQSRGYCILEDGRAVHIDEASMTIPLSSAGFNASERAFKYALAHLQSRAALEGRRVELSRWATFRDGRLYVSSGPTRMVIATPDGMTVAPNGTDGVLFAADGNLAEWEPTDPVDPLSLRVLRENLTAPHEVPEYDAGIQEDLLRAWLVCLLRGTRPLPAMAALGSMHSGKSTRARACLRLFDGRAVDLSPPPRDVRDLLSIGVNRFLHGVDNLDSDLDPEIMDVLAVSVTGGRYTARKLYTDAELTDLKIRASLMITSRTGLFAQRADVADRCLPVFQDPPEAFVDEVTLLDEVAEHRAGALTWLAQYAVKVDSGPSASSGRFPAFARTVAVVTGSQERADAAVSALQKAQRLALTDLPPLVKAIIDYMLHGEDRFGPARILRGTPSGIVKDLEEAGHALPPLGGGKAIMRQIQEARATLALNGVGVRIVEGRAVDATRRRKEIEIHTIDT